MVSPTDIDLTRLGSPILIDGASPFIKTGEGGREERGVLLSLRCKNCDNSACNSACLDPVRRIAYLLQGKCMHRRINTSLADKEVMVDDRNVVLCQLDICYGQSKVDPLGWIYAIPN